MHDHTESAFQDEWRQEMREKLIQAQDDGVQQIELLISEKLETFQRSISTDLNDLGQRISNLECGLQAGIGKQLARASESLVGMVKNSHSELVGNAIEQDSRSTALSEIKLKLQHLTEQSILTNDAVEEKLSKIDEILMHCDRKKDATLVNTINECIGSAQSKMSSDILVELKAQIDQFNENHAIIDRFFRIMLLSNFLLSAATIAYLIMKIG